MHRISVAFLWIWTLAASVYAVESDGSAGQEPPIGTDAASLVRKVRESENWIHSVDSFYLRIDSKWTNTPECIAARRAELKKRFPDFEPDPKRFPGLRPISTDQLEFAFDRKRVRHLQYDSAYRRALHIWDGEQLMCHEEYFSHEQENYYLASEIKNWLFHEFIAIDTSWLRAQPHSFWFDRKDRQELMKNWGMPENFVLRNPLNYRGVDCYVLDCDQTNVEGMPSGLLFRWYVGRKDNLLYGIEQLRNGKLSVKHWLSDYKQIAPGCWFPMTQGYELYGRNIFGKAFLESHRDLKVLEVKVGEKLPDELFKMEFKEDVEVIDERFSNSTRYRYRPELPLLTGKALPKFNNIKIDFTAQQAQNKKLLVCFWDMQQRPSRHCIQELAKQAGQLKEKGVVVIAVQASKVERSKLDEMVKKYDLPFTVGMIEGNEEETRFKWGVKSLPWLILADKEHIVSSNGFSITELDEKLKQLDGE